MRHQSALAKIDKKFYSSKLYKSKDLPYYKNIDELQEKIITGIMNK